MAERTARRLAAVDVGHGPPSAPASTGGRIAVAGPPAGTTFAIEHDAQADGRVIAMLKDLYTVKD